MLAAGSLRLCGSCSCREEWSIFDEAGVLLPTSFTARAWLENMRQSYSPSEACWFVLQISSQMCRPLQFLIIGTYLPVECLCRGRSAESDAKCQIQTMGPLLSSRDLQFKSLASRVPLNLGPNLRFTGLF